MISDAIIQQYIELAKITGFLATQDIAQQDAFQGGAIDPRLPRLLYIVRKSVEWTRVSQPNTTQLTAMALYMYSLCGRYLQKAYAILGQAGGIIVNPSTGVSSTIAAINYEFTIGQSGSPINAGDTVLAIPYLNIQLGSINIFLGGNLITPNQTTQFSYTISADNTVVTFNQGVMNGQIFQVTGQYFVNL
jgi:hypothetical protein